MNVQSTAGKHLWKAKDVKKSTPDAHLNANTARTVSGLKERAEVVASIAAETAVTVDRDARFPHEAFAAARSQRLLGVMVPHDLGGEGASLTDVLDVCYILGRACASTGMIYAMHQTKMALVLRHGCSSPWHRRLLRRLSEEQLLLASSTTEGQRGGDVRNSVGAIEAENGRIALVRDATVISYGQHADGIVTTARRSPDAATLRSGARRILEATIQLAPSDRLGHAGHARYVQLRIQTARVGREWANLTGAL